MKFKSFLIAFFIYLCFLLFPITSQSEVVSTTIHSDYPEYSSNAGQGYIYVLILEEDVWWVLVYDDQGILIDEYAED